MNALYVAWRSGDDRNGQWGPVGRLEHCGGLYRFYYTRGARMLRDFRPFPQMDRLEEVYESDELFPFFSNRLLSRSREEYDSYLRWGGFDPDNPPEPIAILGVTEGVRHTDAAEVFPCPIPDHEGCYISKFFLHGVRWMPPAGLERIHRLQPNERLLLMLDILNPFDGFATAVRTVSERTLIGYVPRYFARDVQRLVGACDPDFIDLTVERINLDAPLGHRVLCRIRACWPDGFQPCNDDAFQPIRADVATGQSVG